MMGIRLKQSGKRPPEKTELENGNSKTQGQESRILKECS